MNKQKYIKAPYNFVPLSEKVFSPTWAGQVSHDIPFSDGESGIIEVTLKAETPVFIRNTDFSNGDDKESSTEFCHYIDKNGKTQYYIPGTSVKGMIRSVLEIMSFGKIKVDERLKYATRDWDNENVYELKNVKEQGKIRCGYLIKKDNTYYIEDHGKPYRIGHKEIDSILGSEILEKYFSKRKSFNLNDEYKDGGVKYDPKTAKFKYSVIRKESDLNKLKGNTFSINDGLCDNFHDNRVKINQDGEIFGDIILTGQPDKWVYPPEPNGGKYWEFVFKNDIEDKYPVSVDQMNDFEFIYEDSDDWKYWKEKGRIPVFFRKEGEKIKDFGLAFMYKVPFLYKPVDLISKDHKNNSKRDLAETIFGSIKNEALKGRVQCSNFELTTIPRFEPETTTILGSPKASYYPIYIKQNGPLQKKGKHFIYSTYNDSDASLSGWKRYPVKNHFIPEHPQGKITTTIKPISKDAVFKGKIRYHNLRPVELGALLSALTFHNSDGYFHSIGMAKPYGCGAVSLLIKASTLSHNTNTYYAVFEKVMNQFLGEKWVNSINMKELFAMSSFHNGGVDRNPYMSIDKKDYIYAKKNGEDLKQYSETHSLNPEINSVLEKLVEIEKDEKKKEEARLKDDFNSLIDKLRLDFAEIDEETLSDRIEQCERYGELDLITSMENYNDLLVFKRIFSIRKLMSENKWGEARHLIHDMPKSVESFAVQYLNQLDEQCKVKNIETINLENAIDLTSSIEKHKGRIGTYLRKKNCKTLPEEDIPILESALRKWKKVDTDPKWIDYNSKRSVWTQFVEKWVGHDRAVELFEKIIK